MNGPAAVGDARQGFILVVASGLDMALRAADVERMLAAPERLDPLPRKDAAIDGVLTVAGQPLPVTSVARWRGESFDGQTQRSVVCVLRSGSRRLGLSIDQPLRTVRLAADAVARLHHAPRADEIFDEVLAEGGRQWPILDVDRLMQVSQVWGGAAASSASAARAPAAAADGRSAATRHAVVRCGATFHAVPIDRVLAATAGLLLQPVQAAPGLLGAVRWRSNVIPLVALPADPAVTRHDASPLLVLRALRGNGGPGKGEGSAAQAEEALLAVAIDEVDRILPLRFDGVDGHAILPGGQHVSALDVDSLAGAFAFAWRPVGEAVADRAQRTQGARAAESYLIYADGNAMAVELSRVQEVLLVPPPLRDPRASPPAQVAWRGDLIPLRPVGRRAPGWHPDGSERLLVLGDAGAPEALMVESVQHLVAGRSAELRQLALPGVGSIAVLTASIDGEQRSFRVLGRGSAPGFPAAL